VSLIFEEAAMRDPRSTHFRRFAAFALATALTLVAPPAQSRTVDIPFNKNNFHNPLAINNTYLPLPVGQELVYRADVDGCEENHVTVTNHTKKIAVGVTAREVHDVVYSGATCGPLSSMLLTEDTFDWLAQDDSGNVWYLGEDSKECDANGCVPSDGSWEAGADIDNIGSNGVPGIIMLANPRKGDSYQQEFYEGHAEDMGEVTGIDVDVTLTRPDARQPRLFHHCLKTKERSLIESGSTAIKYYCPGIGEIAEDEISRNGARSELIDPSAIAFQFRIVH
jgi:hypothetical protein